MLNRNKLNAVMPALLAALFPAQTTLAEFALNFKPVPTSNLVDSIANESCVNGSPGGGGMMGGGMMGFSSCTVDYFLQEVVSDNTGAQFYHILLGNPSSGFAKEYFMRTAGCCWNNGGGMMMGGGPSPYSSSYGNLNNPLANYYDPLGSSTDVGSATGNPTKVYMRMVNNDATMNQEFLKSSETNKPRITQTVKNGTAMTSTFDLDMSNGGYSTYTNPVKFTNSTTVTGVGTYDAAAAPQAKNNAGHFKYAPGSSFSGAYGTYNYESGGINMVGVNWLSYCDPSQNPDFHCDYTSGAGTGGGGGMMGGMGM